MTRWRAGLAAVGASLVAVAAAAVACGPVDKPGAEVDAFAARFGEDPAVDSIRLSGTNDGILFAAGVVSGDVTLVRGLDDTQVEDVVNRIGSYVDTPEVGSHFSSLDLRADGITMGVSRSPERRATQLDLLLRLREDDDVSSAVIHAPGAHFRSSLTIVTPDPGSIPGLDERWTAPVEALSETDTDPNILTIRADDGDHEVRGGIGPWRQAMFAAWRELEDTYTVTSFHLGERSVTVGVSGADDPEDVRAILGAQAPDGMEVTVTAGGEG